MCFDENPTDLDGQRKEAQQRQQRAVPLYDAAVLHGETAGGEAVVAEAARKHLELLHEGFQFPKLLPDTLVTTDSLPGRRRLLAGPRQQQRPQALVEAHLAKAASVCLSVSRRVRPTRNQSMYVCMYVCMPNVHLDRLLV